MLDFHSYLFQSEVVIYSMAVSVSRISTREVLNGLGLKFEESMKFWFNLEENRMRNLQIISCLFGLCKEPNA